MILVVLTGCSDPEDDGSGDYCSGPPNAIDLVPPVLQTPASAAIAVNGNGHYEAIIEDTCGGIGPPSTFTATTGDPAILTADVSGAEIRVRAHATGSTSVHVRSASGGAADIQVEAKILDHVGLGSEEDGVPQAFLVGAPIAAVRLWSADGQPLIDTSMTVTGAPPGNSLDEVAISGLAVGDHPLAIAAAGASWSATVHIVGTIDEVAPRATNVTLPYAQTAHVCFDAKLAGQVVAGAAWHFTFPPGQAADQVGGLNCVDVWAGGPVSYTITATALGHSAQTQVTFTP